MTPANNNNKKRVTSFHWLSVCVFVSERKRAREFSVEIEGIVLVRRKGPEKLNENKNRPCLLSGLVK